MFLHMINMVPMLTCQTPLHLYGHFPGVFKNTCQPRHEKTGFSPMRKQRRRSTSQLHCEADKRLCFHYSGSTIPPLHTQNFKILSYFYDCTDRFVSDLVGNIIVGFLMHRLNSHLGHGRPTSCTNDCLNVLNQYFI